jgi:hypothetical protein
MFNLANIDSFRDERRVGAVAHEWAPIARTAGRRHRECPRPVPHQLLGPRHAVITRRLRALQPVEQLIVAAVNVAAVGAAHGNVNDAGNLAHSGAALCCSGSNPLGHWVASAL